MMIKIVSKNLVDSTNNEAKRYLQEMKISTGIETDTFLLVCDKQTNAKGRFDRPWLTPHHNIGLTFAVPRPEGCTSLLPFYATTQHLLRSILSEFIRGRRIEIKWPNNIIIENKKISCTLIEYDKNEIYVGININHNLHGKDVGSPAADIAKYNATALGNDVIKRISQKLQVYSNLFEGSELMSVVTQNYNLMVNQTHMNIEVLGEDGKLHTEYGFCSGIDNDGRIMIYNKDGVKKSWGAHDTVIKD